MLQTRFTRKLSASAVLALLALSAPAFAQEKGGFAFSFGGSGGPGIMLGGPMNMRGPAKFGAIDPAYRNTAGLLLRNDVRTELVLSAKQREEVEAIEKGEKAAPPKPLKFEFSSHDGGSPEEMREKVENQMREIMSSTMDDRNKKAETALRAEQVKRISELDLQWRGPLALVDSKLAEEFQLTAEQRQKVQEYYREYRTQQGKIMMEAMKDFTETQESNDSEDGNTRKSVAIRVRIPDPKDMTPKQKALFEKRDKDIEQARKAQGEKALALLNEEQKQHWQSFQGRKFTFRVVD